MVVFLLGLLNVHEILRVDANDDDMLDFAQNVNCLLCGADFLMMM